MTSATVHHLPTAIAAEHTRDLDEQVKTLEPGQWVRVTWADERDGSRGVTEGELHRPSKLQSSLFVGSFCLRTHGFVNANVTAIDTVQPPRFDMEDLAPLVEDWAAATVALEAKPVGHFKTGDNTAEANAVYVTEQAVVEYLKSVTI